MPFFHSCVMPVNLRFHLTLRRPCRMRACARDGCLRPCVFHFELHHHVPVRPILRSLPLVGHLRRKLSLKPLPDPRRQLLLLCRFFQQRPRLHRKSEPNTNLPAMSILIPGLLRTEQPGWLLVWPEFFKGRFCMGLSFQEKTNKTKQTLKKKELISFIFILFLVLGVR